MPLRSLRSLRALLRLGGSVVLLGGLVPWAGAQEGPGDGDLAARAQRGRSQYRLYCTGCHGWAGRGDGPMARSLQLELVDFRSPAFRWDADGDGRAGTRADLRRVIRDGIAAYEPACDAARADASAVVPPACMMPGFAEVLDDAAIGDVIAYLRSLEGRGRR